MIISCTDSHLNFLKSFANGNNNQKEFITLKGWFLKTRYENKGERMFLNKGEKMV